MDTKVTGHKNQPLIQDAAESINHAHEFVLVEVLEKTRHSFSEMQIHFGFFVSSVATDCQEYLLISIITLQ
jgi:hypothetical protein